MTTSNREYFENLLLAVGANVINRYANDCKTIRIRFDDFDSHILLCKIHKKSAKVTVHFNLNDIPIVFTMKIRYASAKLLHWEVASRLDLLINAELIFVLQKMFMRIRDNDYAEDGKCMYIANDQDDCKSDFIYAVNCTIGVPYVFSNVKLAPLFAIGDVLCKSDHDCE